MSTLTNQITQLKNAGFRIRLKHSRYTAEQFNKLRRCAEQVNNNDSHLLDRLNELTDWQPMPTIDLRKNKIDMSPRGGKTFISIEKDDKIVSTSEAICSFADNFCYRVGGRIALGRALKNLKEKVVV